MAILSSASSVSLINSTFSGNIADRTGFLCGSSSGEGGAVHSDAGSLTIINSTFSGNSGFHGDHISSVRGSLSLANTILANGGFGRDCDLVESPVVASGKNLVGDGSCAADTEHFIIGNPMLGPLADNGGPTQTFALLPGSAAIDAADNAVCAAARLQTELQKIYDSEINIEISWMSDGPIRVKLGNEFYGFDDEGTVTSMAGVLPWLQDAIHRHYPESKYDVERLGGKWEPKWFGPEDYTIDGKPIHEGRTIKFDLVLAADRITGDVNMVRDGQTAKAKIDVTRAK
jgi:hypothetical protein